MSDSDALHIKEQLEKILGVQEQQGKDISLMKLCLTGNEDYQQKGLIKEVHDLREYVDTDKRLKAKVMGGALVVGTLWTVLTQFWNKLFE